MQNSILLTHDVLLALGRCIPKQFGGNFRFILVSVHMVMVCVCTLFRGALDDG
jgi:hypothetical protein